MLGSLDLPFGSADRPGPGFFPLLVGIVLVTLSLPLFIRSVKEKESPPGGEEPFPRGKDLNRVMAVGSAVTGFALLLNPLGYGVCSAALMGVILKILGMRNWPKIAIISILTAAISFYLFVSVLDVPLPRGIVFS